MLTRRPFEEEEFFLLSLSSRTHDDKTKIKESSTISNKICPSYLSTYKLTVIFILHIQSTDKASLISTWDLQNIFVHFTHQLTHLNNINDIITTEQLLICINQAPSLVHPSTPKHDANPSIQSASHSFQRKQPQHERAHHLFCFKPNSGK